MTAEWTSVRGWAEMAAEQVGTTGVRGGAGWHHGGSLMHRVVMNYLWLVWL